MIQSKYPSLTTPSIEHDVANILTEFIWLNRDINAGQFPWRDNKEWGKMVAAIKKLMGEPYHLTHEQIAFYIYKCYPQDISPFQFAKMAVVARKLFRRYDLEELHRLYAQRRKDLAQPGLAKAEYKQQKPKTLLTFLKELERGET